MAQTTQNQTPAGGVNPAQEEVNKVKSLIINDIKTKLSNGELLMKIFNNFDIRASEIQRQDLRDKIAEYIATLIFKARRVSVEGLHEGSIRDFLAYAKEKGYEMSDIGVRYDIDRGAWKAWIYIRLELPNGYSSSTIEYIDSDIHVPSLAKTDYLEYTSLVESVKAFLTNIKNLAKELAEELAKEKKGEEEGEEEEEEGEEE